MDTRRVETVDEIIAAISDIAANAGRQLMFFLPDARDEVWSSPALLQIVRSYATARSHREASWLFGAVGNLARDHGSLAALAQRLPSLVLLRQADVDFTLPAAQGFVANDRGQLLLLDSGERLAGIFTNTNERSRPLAARFDEAWERARPLSELRALGI
ncbi:DUF7931 domain-containing protein [Solilutibacter tolerans]|uniref:DUF7931 domain-containing protein n=1 Tax=Solilutibacter tolerans TaxID=1604334 RepID=A0A1N6W887_9GAMM|nr:hypothetical protein [Lysobacter tolerans]SIQ86166.1 hypothetical protein SAMN05421546_1987 [Lysobacter tolerans]